MVFKVLSAADLLVPQDALFRAAVFLPPEGSAVIAATAG
jgi:hypothetical protein